MSYNPYSRLKALFPAPPLLIGEVLSASGDIAVVELPDGARIFARGAATVGNKVFVRDNVIEGVAPDLPPLTLEI